MTIRIGFPFELFNMWDITPQLQKYGAG